MTALHQPVPVPFPARPRRRLRSWHLTEAGALRARRRVYATGSLAATHSVRLGLLHLVEVEL